MILAVNTHWDHIGVIARRQSAAQITQWLASNTGPCEQAMLFGDFNSDIDSAQLRMITESSLKLRDARAASKSAPFGPAGTFNNFSMTFETKAIDHFFLGKQIEVERYLVLAQLIDGRWPSDHFPVFVDLNSRSVNDGAEARAIVGECDAENFAKSASQALLIGEAHSRATCFARLAPLSMRLRACSTRNRRMYAAGVVPMR